MEKKIGWIVGAFLVIVLIAGIGGAFSDSSQTAPATTEVATTTTTTEAPTTYVVLLMPRDEVRTVEVLEDEEVVVRDPALPDSEIVCGGDPSACEEFAEKVYEHSEVDRVWVGPTRFTISSDTSCSIRVAALDVIFESSGALKSARFIADDSLRKNLSSESGEGMTCEAVWPPED